MGGSVVLGVLALVLTRPGAAQPGDDLQALGNEIEALKAGRAAIRKELQEIRGVLRAPQAAQARPRRAAQAAGWSGTRC